MCGLQRREMEHVSQWRRVDQEEQQGDLGHDRQEQFGAVDANTNKAATCSHTCIGSEDLVNFAIEETLLHDGTVYAAEPREMPSASAMAAIFRY